MLDREVYQTLTEAFPESYIEVLDPMNDQTHLEAIVVSPLFEGKSLLEQHRMVMGCLKGHFDTILHALALKTYSPNQWKQIKG